MNFIAVNTNVIIISRGNYISCYFNDNSKKVNLSIGAEECVRDLVISNDSNYLAVLTSSKKIIVYDMPSLDLKKTFNLSRGASKIRFGVDSSHIFVADKTGDVMFYNIFKDENGTKLLGHLSLLLNVLQSNDGNYLISSDRDEKIRVSCYPNTYNIQTYCLGHREFVNHIELLPHDDKYLLSASGDGTIKCWDYRNGHLCCNIDTKPDINDNSLQMEFKKAMDEDGIEVENLPIVNFSTTKFDETTSFIAVSVHLYKNILIYSLQTSEFKFQSRLVHTIELESSPSCIQFHNQSLFVFNECKGDIIEYSVTNTNDSVRFNVLKTIKMFEDSENTALTLNNTEEIKVLFKRKFDNVQEYQERKRTRLEKTQC